MKNRDEDDDDEDNVPVLVEAVPKKALPSPKEKKATKGGAVPTVPRKKDD